ncbi:ethanolamine utilization protein EutH [Eubacterium barkeri]|uniref:Ethanolamine transporter n=1 Tax=Eubacterium barkeri TaxID=1528 RepID=A0A1H3AP13_EUBBA|nr:ethanolamine utilization protein EutH [Eubacterium barkeri]SDX31426.1 ethanolamine transporter [Eubacterium barkeri]
MNNVLVLVMLALWVLGFLDSLSGGHLKISKGYFDGVKQIGNMVMLIVGFYCISVVVATRYLDTITAVSGVLPFDPAVLVTMVLETGMGGLPVAQAIASTPELGLFAGTLVASSIGCLVCFMMPVILSFIDGEDLGIIMNGIIPGVLAVPPTLFIGGLLLSVPLGVLCLNLLPVLFVCALLILGVSRFPQATQRGLLFFGRFMERLAHFATIIVIIGLFLPEMALVPRDQALEGLGIALKMTVTLGGGMVLSEAIIHYFNRSIAALSRQIGINTYSLLGILLSFMSSLIMLPMFKDMDYEGKLMNGAFSVMGSYVIGAQMAFVAQFTTGSTLVIFMGMKVLAGFLGMAMARFMFKKHLI